MLNEVGKENELLGSRIVKIFADKIELLEKVWNGPKPTKELCRQLKVEFYIFESVVVKWDDVIW